jgi:hypothetical protein
LGNRYEGSIPFTRSNIQKTNKINGFVEFHIPNARKVRIKVRMEVPVFAYAIARTGLFSEGSRKTHYG